MAVNKVEINGEVKLDLTQDTVTAAKLAQGETAHDASGKRITGTMIAPQLQIIVTTGAGATVTATKGSKTVSGTADASGHCTLTVDEVGIWTVTALSGSMSKSIDVVVGSAEAMLNLIDPVFANNDWSAIIAACQSGSVPDDWAVGDSKEMTIGTKAYQIDIIGKNHDDYADGSGKAPLTFQLHDCYADTKQIDSSGTNSGGWTSCTMRQTHLPAILVLMPTEVQNGIREVNKLTSAGNRSSTINTTADKLFLLSEIEIFGRVSYSKSGEGTQYAYYKAGNRKVKKRNGSAYNWWERSPNGGGTTGFCFVNSSGNADYYYASDAYGVSFAFCF